MQFCYCFIFYVSFSQYGNFLFLYEIFLLLALRGSQIKNVYLFQRQVVKMWNSESLPRLLIAATFMVSVQWLLYGYISQDNYIMVGTKS